MILTTLFIILISSVSFATKLVVEGKTPTALGNFRVETAEQPLVVNGIALDTYVISYDKSDIKVRVAVEKENRCDRYITVSDELSVLYVCNKTYFGIEILGKKYSGEDWNTGNGDMNRSAYFHQKVLSQGENDKLTCISLIASYFPDLLVTNQG